MTAYSFHELVDITQVRQLLESHHALSGMAYGVFDPDENNLVAVGWQEICVRFHRVHPVSCARCHESDAYIKGHLRNYEGDFIEYRCKNGMIDVAMPIVIDGRHVATFFTGQFFYADQKPDRDGFLRQARELGFDEGEYQAALERVPVLSRQHIRSNMLFLRNMVRVMARTGFNNLELIRTSNEVRAAQQELELAAQVFEQSRQSIVITDPDGVILKANSYFTEISGFTLEEAVGQTPRILKSNRHDPPFYREMWQSLREKGHWRGEIWNRKKSGEGFAAFLTISSVRDPRGDILHYIGMIQDITEQKLSRERINRLANFDILTDLPNRHYFKDRFSHALRQAQCYGSRLALLFLDLDDFKKVNETLGHHAGDLLLRKVARRLHRALRKDDCVARMGGDEFAVMLEGVQEPADVERVAAKMIAAVSAPIDLEGTPIYLGASIGVSISPDDGDNVVTLFSNADTAMYRAKATGKGQCQFFDAALAAQSARRLTLENELREAIERDLYLVYQPQADVAGGRVIGVEALVRWRHRMQGTVNPVDFITIAEETGLIHRLGAWVLETACRQAAHWIHDRGIPLRMAVNVSALQLHQPSFFDMVREMVGKYRLPPSSLELEVTESHIMAEVEETVKSLNRLKAQGINIAIDDFGTGYSSLSYLKKLPVDRLKIDRSFISDLPGNREDIAITRTIIAMARGLNLQVIAEGVETESQLEFLRAEGCDEFQGYVLAKPLLSHELETLLESLRPRGASL